MIQINRRITFNHQDESQPSEGVLIALSTMIVENDAGLPHAQACALVEEHRTGEIKMLDLRYSKITFEEPCAAR